MADLVSSKSKMVNAEIESGSIESEALNQRIGANINGLIDQTDSNETTLAAIEAKPEQPGALNSFNVAPGGTLTAASESITPGGTKVLVVCSGQLINELAADDSDDAIGVNPATTLAFLRVRKNGALIYEIRNRQFSIHSGAFDYAGLTFLDSTANAGVSNNYQIEVENLDTDTLRSVDAKIDLLEF